LSDVIKLELKRANVSELVLTDPTLKAAPLVLALGHHAPRFFEHGVGRRYPSKAALFRAGDSSDSLFFVLKGSVRITAAAPGDGEAIELGVAGRGDVAGEAEVLSGQKSRTESAVADGDVDAVELPRTALLDHSKRLQFQVEVYLKQVHQQRRMALELMKDFLNRW
jgi:CRP-like cAMP-binding protein